MSTPPAPSAATDPPAATWPWFEAGLRRLGTAEPWLALLFLLLSFGSGVFWFVLLVSFLAVGLATAITVIGIPILAATLYLWVGGARLERWRIGRFTGRPIPSPYRPLPKGSLLRRARTLATDPAVWRDLCYLFLLFPLGIVELVVAAVALALPVTLVTLPLWFWSLPGGLVLVGSSGSSSGMFVPGDGRSHTGWLIDSFSEALVAALLGVALAVVGGWLVTWTARGHARLGRLLLGTSGNSRLVERVETLTRSRSAVVEAQLAERQRIERDLHDGAQQRLVSLAMGLGMAKEKLRHGVDPDGARLLVESSHEEAKRVLAELRDLVRGIHPAILADRGLDAAISAVAARSPVPVRVDTRLDGRPAEAVEAAAYFVVVEALANVAKHSSATEAWVSVRREGAGMVDDRLVVDVVDNGLGGADPANGTGLSGLRDRVAALDGRLSVDSRTGGPTWVMAELPWEAAPVGAALASPHPSAEAADQRPAPPLPPSPAAAGEGSGGMRAAADDRSPRLGAAPAAPAASAASAASAGTPVADPPPSILN